MQGQAGQGFLRGFWEKHPALYELAQILGDGQWVSHVFEWVFMMVSRFAGYMMTFAIGYLIYYAIETKHSIDAIPVHPGLADNLAVYSNVIINVAPELVFPGVVVMCMRAFAARRWWDGVLYLVTSAAFVILTMVLLNAFMNNGISQSFLAGMLFWRAGAALFYTVVVAYCSGHGGLDLKTLLAELDGLREQIESRDSRVTDLEQQLDAANVRINALTRQEQDKDQEIALQKEQLERKQSMLKNGHGEVSDLSGQLQNMTSQLSQVNQEKLQLTSQVTRSQQQVSDLSAKLQAAEKQVNDLTKEVTSLTAKLQDMTSSIGQAKEVRSKRSQAEEVTSKPAQGTVLQFTPKGDGRTKHDPREVKAWCEAHKDLTQAEQAEQLGISDAANLRRILRKARELEEAEAGQPQAANDL
jgi:peptidoglycan hydrolase CwlO-like protein